MGVVEEEVVVVGRGQAGLVKRVQMQLTAQHGATFYYKARLVKLWTRASAHMTSAPFGVYARRAQRETTSVTTTREIPLGSLRRTGTAISRLSGRRGRPLGYLELHVLHVCGVDVDLILDPLAQRVVQPVEPVVLRGSGGWERERSEVKQLLLRWWWWRRQQRRRRFGGRCGPVLMSAHPS